MSITDFCDYQFSVNINNLNLIAVLKTFKYMVYIFNYAVLQHWHCRKFGDFGMLNKTIFKHLVPLDSTFTRPMKQWGLVIALVFMLFSKVECYDMTLEN